MQGSRERVLAVIQGRLPDRPPLYDCIRNDAVISHFAGETLTIENAAEVVPRAFRAMLDATRPPVRLPEREREEIGEDGRRAVYRRWTCWHEHVKYPSAEAYARARRHKPGDSWDWTSEDQDAVDAWVARQEQHEAAFGDLSLFWGSPASPDFMGLCEEVGIEQLSYYLADCPAAISESLERQTSYSVEIVNHVPESACPAAVFIGDDIAFKTGTICSPAWLRQEYFPRLKRVIGAWHRRGAKVLFHSDGNLMHVLDDLVEAGIDGLNPIETLAGMDVAEIHRRYPHLFMSGGIDVSQLLPYGTPARIRDATLRAIEDSRGRLMPGSTTEIHNAVPLENYLAMRETVLDYRF